MSDKQNKIWGETKCIFHKNNIEIHRIEVLPHSWCSKHKHEHKFNLFFVETGKITIHVWKNDYDLMDSTVLEAGQSTTVEPGEWHKFETHAEGALVYEIYWTEINKKDIVREDHGGRRAEISTKKQELINEQKNPSIVFNNDDFDKHLKNSSEVVSMWPVWKQTLLGGEPTFPNYY